jgi:hypothetical protein
MTNRARRTLAVTIALALSGSADALAAGALNGKTYEAGAPSMGVSSEGHHHARTHATGNISLRVAANGRSVTVRFSSSSPVFYCDAQEPVRVQSTKPASISSGATFKATIDERFKPGPGASSIVEVVTGHFSGHTVTGTIHTQAAECSGVASFSAKAR